MLAVVTDPTQWLDACEASASNLRTSSMLPRFCCAILIDPQGRLLMELRPPSGGAPPRRLTCFGGSREPAEPPLFAVRRELREELALTEAQVEALGLTTDPVVKLSVERPRRPDKPRRLIKLTAWFYAGRAPDPELIRTEPGHEAVWLSWDELREDPRLAAWHRVVLTGWHDRAPLVTIHE